MSAHTKGPWERKSIPGHLFEVSSGGDPVLRIRGGMMPTLADARLIAAAPELLAALTEVQNTLAGPHTAPDLVGLTTLARAAIAKATGAK